MESASAERLEQVPIFPGEIAEGNGKRQVVIDERADEVNVWLSKR